MDISKVDGPQKMRDSGLGSLGSESDTSPSQPNHLTAVNNTASPNPVSPQASTMLAAVDIMTGSLRKVSQKKFPVTYVGFSVLDRRYSMPQFWKCFIPWLVAEVKRKPKPHNVVLQVHAPGSYTLNGYNENMDKLLFEHKLQQLSKFSRIHRDTKCFVYLTKGLGENFVCHVYQAPNEAMVSSFLLLQCIAKRLTCICHDEPSHIKFKLFISFVFHRLSSFSNQSEMRQSKLYLTRLKQL